MPVNVGGYVYTDSTNLLGTISNPAVNATEILTQNPNAQNGYYYIKSNLGPLPLYCIMNSSVDGGGWMAVNSTLSPLTSNTNTSATWTSNSTGLLYGDQSEYLDVSVVEVGCGGTSFYFLRNPNDNGISYTDTMLLMERETTIGQCSAVSSQVDAGYYSGPVYSGTFTSYGMCRWSDGIFANGSAQAMSGLAPHWVIFGSGTNPDLRYQVQCASGTGTHNHMWFIK